MPGFGRMFFKNEEGWAFLLILGCFDVFHSVINTVELLAEDEDDDDKPDDGIIQQYIELLNNLKLENGNQEDKFDLSDNDNKRNNKTCNTW